MQKLDQHLYRNGAFFALAFFALALWAFWPSYFSRMNNQEEPVLHFHGLAMTTWCLLLIVLALLLLYHASVLYFYQFPFWRSFSEWFLSLPLS